MSHSSQTAPVVAPLKGFPWSRWAVATLFVGIPMLFVLALLHFLLDLHREEFRETERRELVSRVWKLTDEAHPQAFFTRVGRDLDQRICAAGYTPEVVNRCYQEVSGKADLQFEAYVFDASGTLLLTRTHPEEKRRFVQDVWMFHRTDQDSYYEKHFSRMKMYFGQYFSFQYFIRRPGQAMLFHGRNGNGVTFWVPGPQKKLDGMLLLLDDAPPLAHFLQHGAAMLSQSGLSLWLMGPDGVEKRILTPKNASLAQGSPPQTPKVAGKDLRPEETVQRLVLEESLQVQDTRVRARREVLWKLAPIKTPFLNSFFLLLVPLLIGVAVWYGGQVDILFVSIRTKLFFLFLYLTLVATLGFATLGLRQSIDRSEVAYAEAGKAAQEVLTKLDSEFVSAKQDCLRFFRSLRDDPHLLAGDLVTFKNRVSGANINWLEVRDIRGEVIYTTRVRVRESDVGFVNKCNAKRNVERYIPERIPPGSPMTYSPPEVLVQSVVESPVSGWLRIFEGPNELHTMQFGQFEQLLFWDFYRDDRVLPATMMVNKNLHVIAWEYLIRRLKERFAHGNTALRIVAWRSDYRQFQPVSFRPWSDFLRLVQRADVVQENMMDRMKLKGEDLLVVAMPGKQLKGIVLAAVYPLEQVMEEIRSYRRNMALTILSSILLALLIGWLLSRAFLRPIAELDRGVQALHSRDPDVRLEIMGHDEFGELAQTFNRTIEEIGEMLFASTIQAQLIPSSPPVVPGYEMVLANVTATDLGGDYCDLVQLPDGRLFLLIGDVTGHGVSSALVMAMAKSAVFSYSRRPIPIAGFMDDLNRLLLKCIGRQKMMTVFAGNLDPGTGVLTFSNGGHPSPLLLRASGESELLDLFHVPVGGYSSQRFPFAEASATVGEGDMLVLYTDGITELISPTGECWGSTGFQAFLRERLHLPLEEVKSQTLAFLRQFAGTPRFEDDVTFILIRRKGTPGQGAGQLPVGGSGAAPATELTT